MTIRYVGPGGNDAWAGTSWGTRKLTLTGMEATPVVAGDTVYVAPGTYRELLTCGVSGVAGSPIIYIGDITGENTDGVGGIVRITGSNDDIALTRNGAISVGARNFRTFRGFTCDLTASNVISCAGTNLILEDCVSIAAINYPISFSAACPGTTIRRCIAISSRQGSAILFNAAASASTGTVIENCLIIGYIGVRTNAISGILVKNCTMVGCNVCVRVGTALTAAQFITVNNCLAIASSTFVQAVNATEIVENYNNWTGCSAHDSGAPVVATGANSNSASFPAFDIGLLDAGYRLGELSPNMFRQTPYSYFSRLAGTGEPTDDLYGMTRPTTADKKSWGAIQTPQVLRNTATTYDGAVASLRLADASRVQFTVPTSNVSTTISVRVYREADYVGTGPQMIIRQPGQSDDVQTDSGAAGSWNQLTTTITPAATPSHCIVELVSNNTAAAGSYSVYFNNLSVT